MYVFTQQVGCDTRWNFKQGSADLNSEFFFSETSYYAQAKEISLPIYS